MIFGPIGIMGGMLLGAAIGGIIAYLGMKAVDYFSSDKFDQLMQDAKDAVADFFTSAFDAFISIITGNGAMGVGKYNNTEDPETWKKMIQKLV